jgi:hypothetical protein
MPIALVGDENAESATEIDDRRTPSMTRTPSPFKKSAPFFTGNQLEKSTCIFGSCGHSSYIRPLRVGPLVDPERAPKSWGFFLLEIQP